MKKSKEKTSDLKSKYKATSLTTLKSRIAEEDAMMTNGGGKSESHEIEKGTNKFRIYPAHPGEKTFWLSRKQHWITVENEEGEQKRRTVYNSVVHGGTAMDIIDEYIKFVKSKAEESKDGDNDWEEKINKIYSFSNGIAGKTDWVCYADKIIKTENGSEKKFGILPFNKTTRDGLNSLSMNEDPDEVIEVDPFTDPETGIPVLITKTGEKMKTEYKTKLTKNPLPLTEKELAKYDKVKPLTKLYRNNYTKKMFDMSCEGLQIFDEENEVGVWSNPDFQDIVAEVAEQYSNMKDKGEENSEKKSLKNLSEMNRDELKKYAIKKGMQLGIKASYSDDKIRKLIKGELNLREIANDGSEKKSGRKSLESIKKKLKK